MTYSVEGGMLNGITKSISLSKKPILLRTYKDNILHGKYIEYYQNGKIKRETTYKNGEPGVIRMYDEEGALISEG